MPSTTIRLGRATGFVAAGAIALALVSAGTARAADPAAAPAQSPAPPIPAAATPTPTPTASPTETPGPQSACTINNYASTSVVIGGAPVKQTFTVDVTGCPNPSWAVGIAAFDGLFAVDYAPTITLSPVVLKNEYAGKVATVVYAKDAAEPVNVISAELDTTFTLLRRSSWSSSVNATPEPVKKGKTIKVAGTLKRVSWNQKPRPGYVGYAGPKVKLQFEADGASSYVTIKTVKVGAHGKVSVKVPAVRTGRWRLVFAGSATTASSTSKSDLVVVKN